MKMETVKDTPRQITDQDTNVVVPQKIGRLCSLPGNDVLGMADIGVAKTADGDTYGMSWGRCFLIGDVRGNRQRRFVYVGTGRPDGKNYVDQFEALLT